MSLVLNTNDSQPYKYSSGNYPDFNQIILTPWESTYSHWTTIDNWPTAYSVNGTKVNELTSFIVAPVCFSSVTNSWLSKISIHNSSWTQANWTIRLWLQQSLEAWLLIWKHNDFYLMSYYFQWNSSWSNKTWNTSWSVTPKILHTDWTLTQITSFSGSSSGTQYNGSNENVVNTKYHSETNWIVSQEWDNIVADISINSSTNYSWNIYWEIRLWYFLWNWVSTVKWIQVSVD